MSDCGQVVCNCTIYASRAVGWVATAQQQSRKERKKKGKERSHDQEHHAFLAFVTNNRYADPIFRERARRRNAHYEDGGKQRAKMTLFSRAATALLTRWLARTLVTVKTPVKTFGHDVFPRGRVRGTNREPKRAC